MPKIRIDQWVSLVLMSGVALLPRWSAPAVAAAPVQPVVPETAVFLRPTTIVPLPVVDMVMDSAQPPQAMSSVGATPTTSVPDPTQAPLTWAASLTGVGAASIYAIDANSGAILLSRNAEQTYYPASTTKMMTALIARKHLSLDTVLVAKPEFIIADSNIGLQSYEQITVESLLRALLMQSSNEAAFMLAQAHPRGYDGFVAEMNMEAARLHLTQTTFKNPIGFDEPGHQSSARDLVRLAKVMMEDSFLREVVSQRTAEITDVTGQYRHQLRTTNQLLGSDGVVGVKTGTTEQAGQVLIAQVDDGNHSILIAVLGSADRFADTRQIISFLKLRYDWQRFVW